MKILCTLIVVIAPLLCFGQIESKKQYSFAGEVLLNDDLIDFDQDGHLDYFVQDYNGTYYHKAIGTAQFAELILLDGIFERYQYEIKDVDHDGDLDVIGFEKSSNTIVINYNEGNHRFQNKRYKINHTTVLNHFTSIDLDNDGVNEIIATYHNENMVYCYKLSGESLIKSTFRELTKPFRVVSLEDKNGPQICIQHDVTKFTKFSTDTSGSVVVKATGTEKSGLYVYQMLDINQDSIADVLLSTNYNAYFRLGNNNGSFQADKNLGPVSLSTSFDIFDVDQDQDLDIIFPRATEYSYSLFRNTGNGNYVNEQIDIDNKTKNIQFISSYLGIIDGRVYKNPLTSSPIAQTQIYEYNAYYFNSIPFDVDGDGDMDILADSQIRNTYTLFENKSGTYYKNKTISKPFANTSTVILDVNNDGNKDIVYLANNTLNWFQNLGSTNFSSTKSLGQISSAETLTSIFPGDFNGDGQMDLGLVNEKDQVFWLARSGSAFNLNKNIILNYTGANDRAAGNYVIDFDNDGDMDIITGDGYGGIDFMENNNGAFTGNLKTLLPGFGTFGLRFVDVNNDGYSDIIRLYHNGSGSSYIMVCINSKNNTLSSNTNIATIRFGTSLNIADINGDGLMDISVLEDDNNRLLWLFNRGNGSFTDPVVADDKVALAISDDVFGDQHEYFYTDQMGRLHLTMAIDAILYISQPKMFSERYFLSRTNEKCDQNNTALTLDDDFKSFELLALDFNDMSGTYDIFTQDTSWIDTGTYGKNKKFSLPKGTAGNGDKTILVKNRKDGYTQSFVIIDNVSCFDTTNITDLDGLMIFHNEMNGLNWQDNSLFVGRKWKELYVKYTSKQNITASEYCSLPGVKCINNQVVEVKLESRNLSGKLTDAISYCRNLENLDLSGNAIVRMPPSMKRFSSLKNLDLFGNDIIGEIPSDIGECSNLLSFDVGANELSGLIPASITKLTKLERLILGGGGVQINKISGEIPNDIGNMTSLKEISFTSQPLTGKLPESMGELKKLEKVNIFLTQIGGNLPSSLAGIFNPKLTVLNLNSNYFTGCIPESYKVFCALPTFSIRYSKASKIDSKEFCEADKHNCSVDNDKDGFIYPMDCDDSNMAIHPDADELDFNDVDENCDGMLDIPCQNYASQNHNTFETGLISCQKLKQTDIVLFPDGNRFSGNVPCFEDISQYSAFWQKFKIYKEGTFYFSISPKDSLSDVDFALYKMSDPNDINNLELIRCNKSICKGSMGLSDVETDIWETENCGGTNNNFLAKLDAKTGEYYALLIIEKNNRKTNVTLSLCGSALLGVADWNCTEKYFTIDEDRDGYNSYVDCDDNNPNIHPGSPEILFNDIDENCDGKAVLPCIDRNKTTNIFSSFESTPLICTKEPLTYPANSWGKDVRSISCGGNSYIMQSYVTVQKIKILKGGSFYFTIKPNVTNQSVIFGVYKTTNNFDKSTLSMVRCCLSGLHSGPIPTEIGLSPFENDEQEGAYGLDISKGKNGFVKSIDAKDGDEYTIYTNSFQPNIILTTTYCGTASFVYDDVECEIVSETEEVPDHHIRLHHNIVSFYLTYESDVFIEDVRIIDINGNIHIINCKDQVIDVSQLPAGVYFCQFNTASQMIYRKFVKI